MFVEIAVTCLALNVYHEARGEPTHGQYAVAQVTIRRATDSGRGVCAEVFRPAQFSWTTGVVRKFKNGWNIARSAIPRDLRAWDHAITVARAALFVAARIPDYSKGATHYHTHAVKPGWSRRMKLVAIIGQHRFYRVA